VEKPPRSIFFWRSSLNLLIITNLGSNTGCCEKPKKSLHQCSCEWWSTTDTCWWYHKPGDKWMRKHQREEAWYPCTEKWPYMDTRARQPISHPCEMSRQPRLAAPPPVVPHPFGSFFTSSAGWLKSQLTQSFQHLTTMIVSFLDTHLAE
jgi:hypothetical protein